MDVEITTIGEGWATRGERAELIGPLSLCRKHSLLGANIIVINSTFFSSIQ